MTIRASLRTRFERIRWKALCRIPGYGTRWPIGRGHHRGVSSMAGEVVTAYRHRNAPIGGFRWVTTTNHHEIGILYLAHSFFFFPFCGVLALLKGTWLASPGATIVAGDTYEQ